MPIVEAIRPGPNSDPRVSAALDTPALSVICGNWLAAATPTSALAE